MTLQTEKESSQTQAKAMKAEGDVLWKGTEIEMSLYVEAEKTDSGTGTEIETEIGIETEILTGIEAIGVAMAQTWNRTETGIGILGGTDVGVKDGILTGVAEVKEGGVEARHISADEILHTRLNEGRYFTIAAQKMIFIYLLFYR